MSSRYGESLTLIASVVLSLVFALPAHVAAVEPAVAPTVSSAVTPAAKTWLPEPNLELDPYYSNASLNFPLTRERVPNLGESSEVDIYRYLLVRSFLPRFVTLEASVYPMPMAGVYLKKNHPHFYDQGDIGSEVNVIESLTAGFREPYALSLFCGNLVDFVKDGERRKGENRAYTGYLFSYGNRHIKNNVLIDDHWYEFEWKLKGDRDLADHRLSWSFRIGGRQHDNPEITDTLYLGLRRSNTEFSVVTFSWLKNSSFELMSEFSSHDLRFLSQSVIFGKKFPVRLFPVALALEIGGIWQTNDVYRGTLADHNSDNFTLVFRPNLVF